MAEIRKPCFGYSESFIPEFEGHYAENGDGMFDFVQGLYSASSAR